MSNVAEAHLVLGLTFGVVFFIFSFAAGALNGFWLDGLQLGSMLGGTVMLAGLLLYFISKWDVFQKDGE